MNNALKERLDIIEKEVHSGKYPKSINQLEEILENDLDQEASIRAKLLLVISEIWLAKFEVQKQSRYRKAFKLAKEALEEFKKEYKGCFIRKK